MFLPVDFKNADYDGLRKYRMINNDDGTVSFQDVTNYRVVGSQFGGEEINAINTAINDMFYKPGDSLVKYDIWLVGLLTATNKDIYIEIPIDKPLRSDVSVITPIFNKIDIRQNNAYLLRVASGAEPPSDLKATCVSHADMPAMITMIVSKESGFGGQNNSLLSFRCELTLNLE